MDVELFVSEKGDQFLVHHAQQSYYQALLEAGVRIYLYKAPFVLHAKHFTIDDEVAVLGSSNMDMRSFSLNMEVSVMLLGAEIVNNMRAVEDTYRDISHELRLEDWLQPAPRGPLRRQRRPADRDGPVSRRGSGCVGEVRAQRGQHTEGLDADFVVLLVRDGVGGDGAADAEAEFRRRAPRSPPVPVLPAVDHQRADGHGQVRGAVERKVADRPGVEAARALPPAGPGWPWC